ncbi:alpha/beta hydrolase [Hymenobacter sp. 15J16-1T3B]|uniref:alpha/beta fold hydrolase n=1 Tax=Hymenobacter sp. 15J16-1T3B TaxID=2886941 RepID=UPI001D1007CD|nr:alpha/beta hydrolase [Hymenobacter sp. 15J16-1T3B]MCC3159766.1 alpha/beta hydrolase [Hymenobacter sp. 15J16-1T3B]
MSYFKFLTLSLLSVALLALSPPVRAQGAAPAKGIKNVLFVHGAYADGSSWAKVIPLLQAKGLNVISVQNPMLSMAEDVAATRRALAMMEGPVLLVGHSSAGMVITEVGTDPKVAGLLYVSALIPSEGQSVADVVAGHPAPGNAEVREDASGFLSLSMKGMNENFAQDLPAAERKVMYATQTPWAKSYTAEKVTNAAWKTKPSWCIIAAQDRSIDPNLERAEAKMIKATTLELNSSHVSMLSQPQKVATFILEATQKLPAVASVR